MFSVTSGVLPAHWASYCRALNSQSGLKYYSSIVGPLYSSYMCISTRALEFGPYNAREPERLQSEIPSCSASSALATYWWRGFRLDRG